MSAGFLTSVFAFIVAIGVLVTVHELATTGWPAGSDSRC
jgi:hypothetical protein